jgi:hypothetical protein
VSMPAADRSMLRRSGNVSSETELHLKHVLLKGPSPNKRVARKDSEPQQTRNERIRKSRSESGDVASSLAE